MSVSFNKNGIVSGDNFYDYNKINYAYNTISGDYEGVSRTHTPTTENNSCFEPFTVHYNQMRENTRYRLTMDIEWSGFDSSNTTGTFSIHWQEKMLDAEGTYHWYNTAIGNALYNDIPLYHLVMSADSGKYRYDVVFNSGTYPSTLQYTKIRYRSNYSNGVGTITLSNIKVVPFLDNTYEMKIKTLDDGSTWARIHWLDVSETVEWFASEAEVAYCVDKSNRYSRMGNVDEFKDANGIYEFMLTYPSLSDTLYNRWTQTSSPNESTVTGFTEVTTAWSDHNGGINLSTATGRAVYDCDHNTTWFAPIGQLSSWTSTQYIPAANNSPQTSTELWVRIDTLPKQLKVFKNLITANDFVEL